MFFSVIQIHLNYKRSSFKGLPMKELNSSESQQNATHVQHPRTKDDFLRPGD